MRSEMYTLDAPARPPVEDSRRGEAYARVRQRVGHAANALVDRVDDSVMTTRRAVRRGARKAEDVVYGAAGEIRRRPFGSVGAAFVAGAVLASTVTWIALRPTRH